MSPERWQQIQDLFDELIQLSREKRQQRLTELEREDPDLGRQVGTLLDAYDQADDILSPLERESPTFSLSESDSRAGTTVGNYEIIREIGRGGMGVVYKARDRRLNRHVVLKFLSPHLSADTQARERFITEARAASALDHPNICTIHDIGEAEDGQTFIVMSYYDGETLKERIARRPIPAEEAIDIARQVLLGLKSAHDAGIVHRDIKPGNLILTDSGQVKILDFGLAKIRGSDLTRTGSTMGTVAYMSPEQLEGRSVDHRADLWAVGAVLFEMLTGDRAFPGEYEQAIIYSILHEGAPKPSEHRAEVPTWLDPIVGRLLARNPDSRYADGSQALEDLNGPAGTDSGSTQVAGLVEEVGKVCYRNRWAAAGASILLVLAGLWVMSQLRNNSSATAASEHTDIIAVLPFSVRGDSDYDYLREGMVDLLSTKLDGAGELRSIDPNAILGFTANTSDPVIDPRRGTQVARHFGAGQFILGNILTVGSQIQITATLYGEDGAARITAQETAANEEELLTTVDALAQQLIARQLTTPAHRLESLSVATTASMPALKAYLQAEQATRKGHFEEAVSLFQEAVGADSAFALAWYRLSVTSGWLSPKLGQEAITQAMKYSSALPERTGSLIEAYNAFLDGNADRAEQLYRSILADYPDEVMAWQQLGEVLFHYNALDGRSPTQARDPLERALTYDPDNREMVVHLMDIAILENDYTRLGSLVEHFFGPEASDSWGDRLYRAVPTLATGTPDERCEILAGFYNAPPHQQQDLLRVLGTARQVSLIERLSRKLTKETFAPGQEFDILLWYAISNHARGRWQTADSAFRAASELAPDGLLFETMYHTSPHVSPRAETIDRLSRQLPGLDTLSIPRHTKLFGGPSDVLETYLSARIAIKEGRISRASEQIQELRARASRTGQEGPDLPQSLGHTLEALIAWTEGNLDETLDYLDRAKLQVPLQYSRSLFYDQTMHRYLRADILQRQGRLQEALDWYRSIEEDFGGHMLLYLPQAYLGQAEIYEQLGDREQAIAYYRRLIELWEGCDRELQPRLEDIRQRTDRLKTLAAAA